MKKILVINTGGTFNKVYNPLTGRLDIDTKGKALLDIKKYWLNEYKIINIIGKDSLDLTNKDRLEIIEMIQNVEESDIIIVHGTDTIDQTAKKLDEYNLGKSIILTGSMMPYSIQPVEAVANFTSAYGYLQSLNKCGVYIAMNGRIKDYKRVFKNKEKGYFEESK